MSGLLHITNGDCAAAVLRAAGMDGDILPWELTQKGDDVLSGEADAWQSRRTPRWLGGVQVSDGRPRWDPSAARLVETSLSRAPFQAR